MADRIATLDAWLLQAIGGTAQYGNGDGDLLHVGRVPSGSADPDYKSRVALKIPLREGGSGVLDGLTSVSSAILEMTVAPNTCIVDGRGANFYSFCDEMTTSFTEKPATGDCNFGSGTGTGVFNISNSATTAHRAFVSEAGLTTGDKVQYDITEMVQAALQEGKDDLYVRLVFANSGGTAIDESAAAPRGTSFYAHEHATSGNRPVLKVTGATTTVAKLSDDSWTLAEGTPATTSTGGTAASSTDAVAFTDALVYAGPAITWLIETDSEQSGRGKVVLPGESLSAYALLNSVSDDDVVISCRFSISKVPQTGNAALRIIARAAGIATYYAAAARVRSSGVVLQLERSVASTQTTLAVVADLRPTQANTDYWLKFLVTGISPSVLAAKLWRATENEPDGYQITVQDSSVGLQVAGAIGLGANIGLVENVPIEFEFDEYNALGAA